MKDHLLAPDMVAEAVRIYTEELAQSQREVAQRRANWSAGLPRRIVPSSECPCHRRRCVEILAMTERVTARQARPGGKRNGPGTGVRGAKHRSQLSVVAGTGFEPVAFRL